MGTTESVDVEGAVRKNLDVDGEQLREAMEPIEQLRKSGIPKKQYDLASPFERPPRRGIRDRVHIARS